MSPNFTSQAAKSTEQQINTANLETWHKRLGHISNENIVLSIQRSLVVVITILFNNSVSDQS